MSEKSQIEWTDSTWNPVVGCTAESEGCKNCYAMRLHTQRYKAFLDHKNVPKQYHKPFSHIQCMAKRLDYPCQWKRPRKIFVNSMSDLFHENVPFDFIWRVLKVIQENPRHIFQLLTKRPKLVLAYLNWYLHTIDLDGYTFPDNLWIGVTVENQAQVEMRVPYLIDFPARVKFVSCEPLLSAVSLFPYRDKIDWLIVGGETGPMARPMDPDWARLLRDQFFGKPFFFKQWGSWAPGTTGIMKRVGKTKLRELDGVTWDAFPEASEAAQC